VRVLSMRSPIFEIVAPATDRHSEWSVKATWPDGKVRRISGFTSEEIASEWIAKASDNWLRNLRRARPRDRRQKSRILER